MLNARYRKQNAKHKIQFARFRMQHTTWKMLNAKHNIQNVKCKIQNAKCEMLNAQYRTFNATCKMLNATCKMQNRNAPSPLPHKNHVSTMQNLNTGCPRGGVSTFCVRSVCRTYVRRGSQTSLKHPHLTLVASHLLTQSLCASV